MRSFRPLLQLLQLNIRPMRSFRLKPEWPIPGVGLKSAASSDYPADELGVSLRSIHHG
jgi:hypothetical protein